MLTFTYILVKFHLLRLISSFRVTETQVFWLFLVFVPDSVFAIPDTHSPLLCSFIHLFCGMSTFIMSLLRMWTKTRVKGRALHHLPPCCGLAINDSGGYGCWASYESIWLSFSPMMKFFCFMMIFFCFFFTRIHLCIHRFVQLIFIELLLCTRQAALKVGLLGFVNRKAVEYERRRGIQGDSKVLTWTAGRVELSFTKPVQLNLLGAHLRVNSSSLGFELVKS